MLVEVKSQVSRQQLDIRMNDNLSNYVTSTQAGVGPLEGHIQAVGQKKVLSAQKSISAICFLDELLALKGCSDNSQSLCNDFTRMKFSSTQKLFMNRSQ